MKFIILLFLFACSTTLTISPKVDTFVTNWSNDFEEKDSKYIQTFKIYLASVEVIYKESGVSEKFDVHLNSFTNAAQILAHHEYILPKTFKRQYGKRPNLTSQDYLAFKFKALAPLAQRLNQEREAKIKSEIGEAIFLKIKSNHNTFNFKDYQIPL